MAGRDQLFAVTTRSRLKGPWLFPSMMIASLRIRRQLSRASKVVRFASIVASPTEFWTITVWRSRHDMQEFMRSGAHDDIMWLFSKWIASFWLMRWRPGPTEIGTWKGVHMARPEPVYDGPRLSGERGAALQKALDFLPSLKSSTGSDGSVTYDNTAFARRRRAEVGGGGGLIVHIATSPARTTSALRALRRLRTDAAGDPDLLRVVVGLGRPGEVYLLGMWADRAPVQRLLGSPSMEKLVARWPGCWANEWLPENEFGHWDGVRLRRARQSHGIHVPAAAMEAADPDS